MADKASDGSQNGAAAEQAEYAPSLMVKAQYVKDFSFENPGAPEILATLQSDPDVNINVNVEVGRLNNGDFEVILSIAADAKADTKQIFLAELSYAGVFAIDESVPEEQHGPILLIECPRLLFPFARNIIADATREGGFPPLMMQPIDFIALYQQQMTQQGGEQANA